MVVLCIGANMRSKCTHRLGLHDHRTIWDITGATTRNEVVTYPKDFEGTTRNETGQMSPHELEWYLGSY